MRVKIGDICTLKSGTSLKDDVLSETGGIPYIKVSDMNLPGNEKFIICANSYATESISSKMLFPEGTILFPKRGGAIGTNKKRVASRVVCADLNTMGVIPSEEIRPLYLYYYFQNIDFGTLYNGSSVPQINNTDIAPMEIELLPLDKQDEIISLLEKVDSIISKRKAELIALDNLIKARFVEMFGDPIYNTQSRPTTEFINVVKMQRGFDLPVQDRQQDGDIPVYGSNGALDYHNVAKVTGGGVITGRSGTIGKVFCTEGDYWPLNTSLFSVDTHGNNVIYLAKLLELYDLSRFVEGTGVPTLNRNMFHNKQIIDVSIDEQNQFADFVKHLDKLKIAVQKALDETQLLFDSLMQKYFGI